MIYDLHWTAAESLFFKRTKINPFFEISLKYISAKLYAYFTNEQIYSYVIQKTFIFEKKVITKDIFWIVEKVINEIHKNIHFCFSISCLIYF